MVKERTSGRESESKIKEKVKREAKVGEWRSDGAVNGLKEGRDAVMRKA